MRPFLILVLLVIAGQTHAQKPIIDTSIAKEFGGVSNGTISADGKFVFYDYGDPGEDKYVLIVQDTKGHWRRSFEKSRDAVFAGKNVVFRSGLDTLNIIQLGGNHADLIKNVSMFKVLGRGEKNLLVYELGELKRELAIRNLGSKTERRFVSFKTYAFSPSGRYLLIDSCFEGNRASGADVRLFDLEKNVSMTVGAVNTDTQQITGFSLDEQNGQFCFITETKTGWQSKNELWYYKNGMASAERIICEDSLLQTQGLILSKQIPKFSKDGNRLFVGLQMKDTTPRRRTEVMVDIWNHKDVTLNSAQTRDFEPNRTYAAFYDFSQKKVIRIEYENDDIVDQTENWVLTVRQLGINGIYEAGWNFAAKLSYRIVSMVDGSRSLLAENLDSRNQGFGLSPGGKWIVYFDYDRQNFFTYEIATKKIRNVTKDCKVSWTESGGDLLRPNLTWYPMGKTWLGSDEAVLISDEYDIWMIDPNAIKPPVNVTNGMGRKNRIKFGIAFESSRLQSFQSDDEKPLLLSAFNVDNKEMGFYRKILKGNAAPLLLSMGPYVYGDVGEGADTYATLPIASKGGGNNYLLVRQSAKEAPNYFVTSDFTSFTPISNFQRHKKYNWVSSELIRWKTLDGSYSSGILYKPENFDPSKKYPLLFEYYENRSDMLNLFITPRFSDGRINIPWFVSRGYLVFVPDIHYKTGQPGQSAVNSVVSAAKHLSKNAWVDSTRMGLQGHSWGAFQTNYIISSTDIFAAACSASGVSDLISAYASDRRGGYRNFHAERGQGRMGGTPWEIPDAYLKNSPILRANHVVTPLLLINNKGDKIVPFEQGLEFFIALRRLKKSVWLLQYDDGYHALGSECARDFTIRMTQFFNHYLKLTPPPKWMSVGVHAAMKGIESGYELTPSIGCGSQCKVCNKLKIGAGKAMIDSSGSIF